MKNVETVNAAFAFDADEGRLFVLNVKQALNFSDTNIKKRLKTLVASGFQTNGSKQFSILFLLS
jgi:hypothetical protein